MSLDEIEEKRSRIHNAVMKYFGLFMVVAYIILGVVVIKIPQGTINITSSHQTTLGLLFIAYGLYRLFKIYRQYFRKRV